MTTLRKRLNISIPFGAGFELRVEISQAALSDDVVAFFESFENFYEIP
jgi:hypothetical protein